MTDSHNENANKWNEEVKIGLNFKKFTSLPAIEGVLGVHVYGIQDSHRFRNHLNELYGIELTLRNNLLPSSGRIGSLD